MTYYAGLQRAEDAVKIATQGLILDPNNVSLREITFKLSSSQKSVSLNKKLQLGNLYEDKVVVTKASSISAENQSVIDPNRERLKHQIMDSLNSILNKIINRESFNANNSMLQGTFKKLTDTSTFVDTVYPGVPVSSLKSLPQDISTLLAPGAAINTAITARLPSLCDSVLSVLEGVRRRGAERGDVSVTMQSCIW